jgi:altronate dehydratase large subunit
MFTFNGYRRIDGQVGSRNYVAVIPTVFCVNEVVNAIVSNTDNTRGLCHHQGCCQLPPDLERTTECLISMCKSPNIGAILLVSLGCEGTDVKRLINEITKTKKPFDIVRVQESGGTSKSIAMGINAAQKLQIEISGLARESTDISDVVMSIKCGSSDATSGLASNSVVGYVADKTVDLGGTVIFGETTEFLGAEHLLARRAVNEEVRNKIYAIVNTMETRAKSLGCDMRKGQPTPGNIAGGLTTIEEKSLGAIMKSGSKPIQGVLEYPEAINGKKGLWIKDTPGRESEILTGMALAGSQCMLFSTGRGAPQGFPTMPVIKICGNPVTYEKLINDMDINAGSIIEGKSSIEKVGEEVFKKLLKVLSGEMVKSEAIRYNQSCDFYMLGPVI